MMILRPYQTKAAADIAAAWLIHRNILYVAPCRSGKTVQMADCIKHNTGASIVLAHRGELVAQMSITLARNGISHRIIGPASLASACRARHLAELKRIYVDPRARCMVASVQTFILIDPKTPSLKEITLWITDEAHHLTRKNAWGKAVSMLPNARGLGVTATPCRADGQGLGRDADGVMDTMIVGPSMRDLIKSKSLTEYKIYAPLCNIDLSTVPISAGGDFSPPKLADAVHKSRIVGDIVEHYLRIAPGKLGVTFAVDIESAADIAAAYRAAGVTAEVISSKTPDDLRRNLQQRHQRRDILQLVAVDILGEGIDIPLLEVVSFGRPTASYGLFIQQFCRPLNPHPDKPFAIIIDHVGNVLLHASTRGLPDAPQKWTLDAREKRSRGKAPDDVVPVRACVKCLGVYERVEPCCPYCGEVPLPATRSSPEAVDGDLHEMSPELLARLRGEASVTDQAPAIPYGAGPEIIGVLNKHHRARGAAQVSLRAAMALYGGWQASLGRDASQTQRRFFYAFGCDVLSAMGLARAEAAELELKVLGLLAKEGVCGI